MRFAVLSTAFLLGIVAPPLVAQAAGPEAVRDPAAALIHYRNALAADSLSYETDWRSALAIIDIGKQTPDDQKSDTRDSLYALAETYARRAVKANPNDAQGHFALANAVGRASLTKGKKERVRRAAEIRSEALRAIELNPQHDGAYHILGRWNAEVMRLSGVTKFFAKSFLGADMFDEASWEGAVANMEKAVELNPTRVYHRLDLAEIYIDRKRYADARIQLHKVERLPAVDVLDPTYKQDGARMLKEIADKKDAG